MEFNEIVLEYVKGKRAQGDTRSISVIAAEFEGILSGLQLDAKLEILEQEVYPGGEEAYFMPQEEKDLRIKIYGKTMDSLMPPVTIDKLGDH